MGTSGLARWRPSLFFKATRKSGIAEPTPLNHRSPVMQKWMNGLLLVLFSTTTVRAEPTRIDVIAFKVPSLDGLTELNGQIDKPECGDTASPTAFIVGGTGLFTRNGYFGRSGTDDDFIYASLANALNQKCIATVRFDFRGVHCDLKSKADIGACVDQNLRSTVTDQTILDDIQAVYDSLKQYSFLDSRRLVLIGHSEGSLNFSRLIARKSMTATGLLFFGGLTESAKSILHWQIAERPVEWAFMMDSNRDGELTNDEIQSGYATSSIKDIATIGQLLSPSGSWTQVTLQNEIEKTYQAIAKEALEHADNSPYQMNGVTFSCYQWWKRWFTDDTSVLENLRDYDGYIEYHNGDIDSQTPGTRERAFLESFPVRQMKSKPKFVVHANKGHGLSPSPLYGPLDKEVIEQLVQSVELWTK